MLSLLVRCKAYPPVHCLALKVHVRSSEIPILTSDAALLDYHFLLCVALAFKPGISAVAEGNLLESSYLIGIFVHNVHTVGHLVLLEGAFDSVV